jgi:hypothetical protein
MLRASVLEEENALPRAELHLAIDNWHGLAGARQDHSDVRWHVVAAFRIVGEVLGVFRHEAIEKLFQIASRGGIGIFHDHDAATGVLNKNCDGSVLDAAFVDLRLHVIGDFVEALAVGADFELGVPVVHAIHVIRPGRASKRSNGVTLRFYRAVLQFAWRTAGNAVNFVAFE